VRSFSQPGDARALSVLSSLGHWGAAAQAAAHEEARRKGFAHMAYQQGLAWGYWATSQDQSCAGARATLVQGAHPLTPEHDTLLGQVGSC